MSICDEIREELRLTSEKIDKWENRIRKKYAPIDPVISQEILSHANTMKVKGSDSQEGQIAMAKIQQIIHELNPVTPLEKIRAVIRISTLGAVPPFVRNMIGNMLSVGLSGFEEGTIAPLIDSIASMITKQERNYIYSAMFDKYGNYAKGWLQGFKTWNAGRKEGVVLSMTNIGQLELKGSGRVFRGKDPISRTMNFFDQVVRQGLAMGDIPFFEAAIEARGTELKKIYRTNKLTPEMQDEVFRYALDKIFLDKNIYSEIIKSMKMSLEKVPNGAVKNTTQFLSELMIPFSQTPGSIMNKIIQHTPLELGEIVWQLGVETGIKKNAFNQRLFVERCSKMITGTGVIALGWALAKKGLITPSSERIGSKEQRYKELKGQREYQLKVKDQYLTINWADPFGTLLAMGADVQDRDEANSLILRAKKAAYVVGDVFLKQSLFRTLVNTMSGYETTQGIAEKGLLSTLIFEPTNMKKIALAMDPRFVETYDANILYNWWNRATQYIPVAKSNMYDKYDALGNSIKSDENWAEILVSPSTRTIKKENDITKEVDRLFKLTSSTDILPNIPGKKMTYNKKAYKIQNAKEYSRWQKITGDYNKKAYEAAMKSDLYKELSDDEKVLLLSQYLRFFKNQAKIKFFKEVVNK